MLTYCDIFTNCAPSGKLRLLWFINFSKAKKGWAVIKLVYPTKNYTVLAPSLNI